MPYKGSALEEIVSKEQKTTPTDDKLDEIIGYLQQMNARDRLRTIGGTIRGLIALIPLFLLLWSAWYFYQHGNAIIKMITDESVKSAASYNQQSISDAISQYLQGQKK